MDAKDRLKIICRELGMKQRHFSLSLGLPESGLSAVFVGRARVSPQIANSVELKHNYRAEWIKTGELPKKLTSAPQDAYDRLLLLVAKELSEKGQLHTTIKDNLLSRIEWDLQQAEENWIEALGNKKESSDFMKMRAQYFKLKRELDECIDKTFKNLSQAGVIQILYNIYCKFFETQESVAKKNLYQLGKPAQKKVEEYSMETISCLKKLMDLWKTEQ